MEFKSIDSKIFNVIKNDFKDFTEIVYYKKPFLVTYGNLERIDEDTGELIIKNSNVDKSRKFELIDGVAVQKSTNIDINKMQHTIKTSRKRALDNLFGYVLSNNWKYWLTITFSPKFVNRNIDEEIKSKYKLFCEKLKYYCPDSTYISVPERHEKGALHFHILLGNCDLSKFMKKAKNKKTNELIKSFGKQVYNLKLFDWGFSTIVETDSNNLNIANYMAKYMVKDFGNIGYNKKSFYHSKNLIFKNKELLLYTDKDIFKDNFLNDLLVENNIYKENENIIVYRVKKGLL